MPRQESPATNQEKRVDAALFRHLLDNSAIPLIGSALGALLVSVAQMETGSRQLPLIWLGIVLITIVLRLWLTRRCRKRLEARGYQAVEASRHALTTSLSGVAWGACSLFFTETSPLAMVVTISAAQAMIMGGALTLGAFMPSFLAFALPAILPLVFVLAMSGGLINAVLALYSAIFLLLMMGVARHFNKTLRQTWQLTFEKEDLVKALTEARDHQSVLAKTDGLTGIANRRHFDEVLDMEFTRLQRSHAPLSIIILDVDHFKAYNDHYGHIAGDLCLKKVAAIFQYNLNRQPDLAARFGGEEFAAILPETDQHGAVTIAERIRAAVSDLEIEHASAATARHLTVSLGVVTVNCAQIDNPNEAIALADRQLYLAKSQGRNRVTAWSADPA